MDVKKIRVLNLEHFADQYGRIGLAERLDYPDTNYVNQLLGGHAPVGGRVARKIESALGLDHGWMDAAHPEKWSDEEDLRDYFEKLTRSLPTNILFLMIKISLEELEKRK